MNAPIKALGQMLHASRKPKRLGLPTPEQQAEHDEYMRQCAQDLAREFWGRKDGRRKLRAVDPLQDETQKDHDDATRDQEWTI